MGVSRCLQLNDSQPKNMLYSNSKTTMISLHIFMQQQSHSHKAPPCKSCAHDSASPRLLLSSRLPYARPRIRNPQGRQSTQRLSCSASLYGSPTRQSIRDLLLHQTRTFVLTASTTLPDIRQHLTHLPAASIDLDPPEAVIPMLTSRSGCLDFPRALKEDK